MNVKDSTLDSSFRVLSVSPAFALVFLLFGVYAYFSNYLDPGGVRHQEFITIDRTKFCGDPDTQADL